MALLEQNLKLGLEAVKYAKEHVGRSANQTYFKPWATNRSKRRNDFLLGATRGGRYVDGSQDAVMKDRRNKLKALIAGTGTPQQKEQQIELWMNQWGDQYFWGGDNDPYGDSTKLPDKMAKALGITATAASQKWAAGGAQKQLLINQFDTAFKAQKAMKFGVGNCQEKAEVACQYLMDQSPGGIRLALYSLDEHYLGMKGQFTNEGGDHVFGVYGLTSLTTNVTTLGPDAIIIDGWMNDAYPAQKYLTWKHGYNYNKERINLKQLGTRGMICYDFKSHVEMLRDFGSLPAGPGRIPQVTIKRTSF